MRKLLSLILISCSFMLQSHQLPVKFWISPIVDPDIKELNVDIEQFAVYDVPCGTYRLTTNNGKSNKYVKLVFDSQIRQVCKDWTCFYASDGQGGFMRIACIDITCGDHDFNISL